MLDTMKLYNEICMIQLYRKYQRGIYLPDLPFLLGSSPPSFHPKKKKNKPLQNPTVEGPPGKTNMCSDTKSCSQLQRAVLIRELSSPRSNEKDTALPKL